MLNTLLLHWYYALCDFYREVMLYHQCIFSTVILYFRVIVLLQGDSVANSVVETAQLLLRCMIPAQGHQYSDGAIRSESKES